MLLSVLGRKSCAAPLLHLSTLTDLGVTDTSDSATSGRYWCLPVGTFLLSEIWHPTVLDPDPPFPDLGTSRPIPRLRDWTYLPICLSTPVGRLSAVSVGNRRLADTADTERLAHKDDVEFIAFDRVEYYEHQLYWRRTVVGAFWHHGKQWANLRWTSGDDTRR